MDIAILITPEATSLNDLANSLQETLEFESIDGRKIYAGNKKNDYLSITLDNNIINLMEEEEKVKINTQLGKSNFFLIEFFDFKYLKILASAIPDEVKFILDNDHGNYVPREILYKMRTYNEFVSYRQSF